MRDEGVHVGFLAVVVTFDVARGSWPTGIPDRDRRAYSRGEIPHCLRVFLTRFFANQFKRRNRVILEALACH